MKMKVVSVTTKWSAGNAKFNDVRLFASQEYDSYIKESLEQEFEDEWGWSDHYRGIDIDFNYQLSDVEIVEMIKAEQNTIDNAKQVLQFLKDYRRNYD